MSTAVSAPEVITPEQATEAARAKLAPEIANLTRELIEHFNFHMGRGLALVYYKVGRGVDAAVRREAFRNASSLLQEQGWALEVTHDRDYDAVFTKLPWYRRLWP